MTLRFLRWSALVLLVFAPLLAQAQGGPPFTTDDPATPGNRHWEINIGWTANHNPGSSGYQTPDIDLNYGWGERVQLKFELPIAVATDGNNTTRVGLGESQPGIKIRLYEHHRAGEPKSDENLNFSVGTYPQAVLNNPTRSVQRGVVEAGPQYYLPIELTTRIGPLKLNGEVGRWISNRHVPDRWGRGLIVGREFSERFELYTELYDLQDVNRIDGAPKQRGFTLSVGGRQTLDRKGHLRLLFRGGRSLQAVTRENGEPNWVLYLGLQILTASSP